MKLVKVAINGFRSIESASLNDCGGFNVLIGKNNAGKSTILLAIDAFFSCLESDSIVSISPSHRDAVDHFNKNGNKPIEFTFDFYLTLAERDALIQDIITEAQSVKNTVEGIDTDLLLSITMVITPLPSSFAHIKKMVLQKYAGTRPAEGSPRTIINVSDTCAKELADAARQAYSLTQEAEYVDEMAAELSQGRFDSEMWKQMRSDFSGLRRARFGYGRVQPPSREIQDRVAELINKSENPSSFRDDAQVFSASLRREVETIQANPLRNQIESFSGVENSVPNYALNLLELLR